MGKRRGGFTLIELLVVIAIIGILSALIINGLRMAQIRAQVARTTGDLGSLKTALSMYYADYRRYPRLAPRNTTDVDALMVDDCPALWAALMNRPRTDLGGGRGSAYLEWKAVGVMIDRSKLAADTMGKDGFGGAKALEGQELTDRHYDEFQRKHGPASPQPLVFLDIWGNPIHYREWESLGSKVKNAIHKAPPMRSGFSAPDIGGVESPLEGPLRDEPRDPNGYDLWSNGPNGVNEYGAPGSDDIKIH